MYLSSLCIRNFRCFDDSEHIIPFNSGLTVLIGENDSGKSAILDAIRIVLGTTDYSWIRIETSDFHNEDTSQEITILCKFSDLSSDEEAAFLECLTYENTGTAVASHLYLHWKCRYSSSFIPPRPISSLSTGKNGNGPALSPASRELLRVTYLKALRDAYSDMQSGKHSRLSQIIHNIPQLTEGENEYQNEMDLEKLSLVGISNLSNSLLEKHPSLQAVNKGLTDIMNEQMLLKGDSVQTRFEVAGSHANDLQKLISLLEKLDLAIDKTSGMMQGKVGLGTSNIMSMACELLLHKEAETVKRSSFLLIEEPEAHVHAQRQLKLIQSLEEGAETHRQQIILTTHSSLLASVVKLKNIVLLRHGNAFPMGDEYTMLEESDYKYLERYLDATKANLFFARSVVIVEGPGEALLLPTLAKLLRRSFTNFGTSLVDVRGVGLRRYARIFQRANSGILLGIKVACITDRDIMPDCAPAICLDEKYSDSANWPKNRRWSVESDFSPEQLSEHLKKLTARADGQDVKTFVSRHWTLEYDLAYSGLPSAAMKQPLVAAIVKAHFEKDWETRQAEITAELDQFQDDKTRASHFYSFFTHYGVSKAEFAQVLASELEIRFAEKPDDLRTALPKYLVDAIEYVTGE